MMLQQLVTSSWSRAILCGVMVALSGSPALAQVGTVDQFSLSGSNSGASIVGSNQAPAWQQEVHAGMEGYLQGISLNVGGTAGATIPVRLRSGEGWSSNPALWETVYVVPGTHQADLVYFDVRSANIQLAVGDAFVIEVGLPSGTGLEASHSTPACYPGELFLGTSTCHADCTYRMEFKTWMDVQPPGGSYCSVIQNSLSAVTRMWASGSSSISANDLSIFAGPIPYQIALIYYGNAATQVPFGNGYRCVAGQTQRLQAMAPLCGSIGQDVDWSEQPAFLAQPGTTLYFQAWYRDPFGGASPFNLSDGYAIPLLP